MSYYYGPVAAMVECDTCGWTSESYKNALAIAKKHTKKYGHKVKGELVIVFGYNYTNEKQEVSPQENDK